MTTTAPPGNGEFQIAVPAVPGAVPTEADIGRQAADAVEGAVNVPATVKVSVHEQTILLSGDVTWQYQREEACRAVDDIEGVTAVVNGMELRRGVVAAGIAKDISAGLVCNAHVEGDHLAITTDTRGAVTLNGTVRSAAEKRQAETVCWRAPGVMKVSNQLNVAG